MRAPCYARIHGSSNVPYRPYRRVEVDVMPIHQQSFPLYPPLPVNLIVTVDEYLDEDEVPIHKQSFPLHDGNSAPSIAKATTTLTNNPAIDATESSQTAATKSLSDASGSQRIESYASLSEIGIPPRQEQKLRGMRVMVGRYISTHRYPLEYPPQCPNVESGDLYVHHHGDVGVQVWLREKNMWISIADGHRHPSLVDYRLFVGDREPTWVTRKTRSTYKGRMRARGQKEGARDAVATPA
ncbi:hypothetical protein M404DRAFT_19242 [Pisolithus tinctorius Marx 270]|uniref:Uncharacterized protein n=1 Tax=Pisolithus tinctorius Marx 270 TaxID=870435 RepID=A0A0C3PUE5_PISTI|nr:hypothetical protein M404DRAFT_19242 [Pisolithus tinctorius Marx 270]